MGLDKGSMKDTNDGDIYQLKGKTMNMGKSQNSNVE